MGTILFGTSSWSCKDWVGPFYPDGTRAAEFLAYYATRFPTVEADSTYYRVPSFDMVSGWARKTPEDFVLAAKFPRSLVHAGEGPRPNGAAILDPAHEDFARFFPALSLLGERCGPLVLQFPYFNRQAFASREPFLERLDGFLAALPEGHRYAVEIRNRNWLDEGFCALLRRHGVALVLTDIAYMPHPADLARRLDVLTADFFYARLIGDRAECERATDRFDRIVLDRRERLERWGDLLTVLGTRADGYVYANNHYAGHGPETARQLRSMVGAGAEG